MRFLRALGLMLLTLGWLVTAVPELTYPVQAKPAAKKAKPTKAKKKVTKQKVTKQKAAPKLKKKTAKVAKAKPAKATKGKKAKLSKAEIKAAKRKGKKTKRTKAEIRAAKRAARKPKVIPKPKPQPPTFSFPLEHDEVKLLNYTLFSVYSPQGSGEAKIRANIITSRLEEFLKNNAERPIKAVSQPGPGNAARILLNDTELALVTQYELAANKVVQGESLSRQWATNLNQILLKPAVQEAYFIYAGLPEVVTVEGVSYTLGRKTVPDYGLFTTDGRQQDNKVIFWRDGEEKPYKAVYMLNRKRQFVVYPRMADPLPPTP